jgi:hypothetical protein
MNGREGSPLYKNGNQTTMNDMKIKIVLIAAIWLVLGIWEAGAFRAMGRHDWPLSEADPVISRARAVEALALGIISGPGGIIPVLIYAGGGAYGWENPFGSCYWSSHPYPCGYDT